MTRISWDEYFIEIANTVSRRATCPRASVGAVIVRDKQILSTGYNGALRGLPHCIDVGCDMEDGHCVRVMHAESNAIVQAAKNGVSLDKGELYASMFPCWPCFRMIVNANITRVIYDKIYRPDKRVEETAKLLHIELIHLGND